MKILGYVITVVGIGMLMSSGNIRHWRTDGMPIWLHIVLELAGFAAAGFGVALINGKVF